MKTLYVLFTGALPWRTKIGITGNLAARKSQIASELSGRMGKYVVIRTAMAIPVLFPESLERWMHRAFERLRAYVPRHSGHTEWFVIRNFWAACCLLGLSEWLGLDWDYWHLAVVYFLPLPLDAVLFLALIFLGQVAATMFIFWAAWLAAVTLWA